MCQGKNKKKLKNGCDKQMVMYVWKKQSAEKLYLIQ